MRRPATCPGRAEGRVDDVVGDHEREGRRRVGEHHRAAARRGGPGDGDALAGEELRHRVGEGARPVHLDPRERFGQHLDHGGRGVAEDPRGDLRAAPGRGGECGQRVTARLAAECAEEPFLGRGRHRDDGTRRVDAELHGPRVAPDELERGVDADAHVPTVTERPAPTGPAVAICGELLGRVPVAVPDAAVLRAACFVDPTRFVLARTVAGRVVEQVLERPVERVVLGGPAGVAEPQDEGLRVVDVLGGGDGVEVRPQGVALLGTELVRDPLPERGGLPEAAGPQLEPDQRRERGLGGATGGTAATDHLGDGVGPRQADGRGGGDGVDPALDEREHRLEAAERGLLLGGARRDERTRRQCVAELLLVRGVDLRRELLDTVEGDVDAARVVGDRRDDVQPEPLRRPEEPRVRELPDRQVDADLVLGDVEALGELGDVLRQEHRDLLVEERDADVATRDDLLRELTDDLAELDREQGTAHAAHRLRDVAEHGLELLRRALVDRLGEGVRDAQRHRLGDLRPHRGGRARPLLARPDARRRRELGDRGRLVEPQRSHLEGLPGGLRGRRVHRVAAVAGDRGRALRRDREVDAVPAGLRGPLQLTHEVCHERRVVRQAGRARELRRVDLSLSGEQLAQHLLEVVVRTPLRFIRHADYANRCSRDRAWDAPVGSPEPLRRGRTARARAGAHPVEGRP
ncbi:hypothetical protein Cus16_1080 [Curtobacterium sp. ER1/6]|nr:hypothetical protein Cus16_1080 [Curtobacterium sp. ER1/6]